ncbi:MAG: hypothetical protein ACREUL_17190 [Steroidobacteraceae bacterium]
MTQAPAQDAATAHDAIDAPQISPRANRAGILGLELIEDLAADRPAPTRQSACRRAP